MDGARLANAAAAGFDLKDIARLGVDVLVFGGAKAGALCAEAIVMFDRSLARRIDNRLKQAGQTASKARFLAAPFVGLLESGAWETGAAHANLMAQRLAEGVAVGTPFILAHPVEANAVFVRMPAEAHQRLNQMGWACYRFDDGSVRFVCSWATSEAAVDELLRDMAKLSA
jgi:threonine aldolase